MHVTWDEETIAEQDKLRGTRQKIDELPTPWAHSPVSDLEDSDGGDAPDRNPAVPAVPRAPRPSPARGGVAASAVPGRPGADPADIAARLREFIAGRSKADQEDSTDADLPSVASPAADASPARGASPEMEVAAPGTEKAAAAEAGRSSTSLDAVDHCWAAPPPASASESAEASEQGDHRAHLVFLGDAEPKKSSEAFKAKRAQHYNEFHALAAFRKGQAALFGKSSDESEGSDG